MELGIYHLKHHNWNDAIFRFKMIDKFLDPNNKIANYWLGWAYFLKNNHSKAIIHLTKAGNEDSVNLLEFVKSIDNVQYVPPQILALHRDIMAVSFIEKFASKTENLPQSIVLALNNVMQNLPEEYSILELGSNIGLLGSEINKRLQETHLITAVECSAEMIKLVPKHTEYDRVIQAPVHEFLIQTPQDYDIIVSLEGFSFAANLTDVFNLIFSKLKGGGYFAFATCCTKDSIFSSKFLEFAYSSEYLKAELTKAGFNILFSQEIALEIKNNYCIFVCTK